MKTGEKRKVLYAEANYKSLVEGNGFYVDKTPYIRLLEQYKHPVFLRPRRFGKSLLCTMLEYYYDIREKENFDFLFGHTEIGQNPTSEHNRYLVLHLDFSGVDSSSGKINQIQHNFNTRFNYALRTFLLLYQDFFRGEIEVDLKESASLNLNQVFWWGKGNDLPPLYIIIDEHDNFANHLITTHQDAAFEELTNDEGFLKNFFKVLKEGAKMRVLARTFITGILPLTIDELASAFNIAHFLTLSEEFEHMAGFTQEEVDLLVEQVYEDYQLDSAIQREVKQIIKNQYNGYHIVNPKGEALYNSTILMYFLEKLCNQGQIPKHLTDMNLKTELSWVKRITSENPMDTEELVGQLIITNQISYNEAYLMEKFSVAQFFQKDFYSISFYFLGMLSKMDDFLMRLPNLNMKTIFISYFNQLHRIDMSTRYAEMMSSFVQKPDIPKLFNDYWELYIKQFPAPIFQKVNENFYRTTFYDLCRQFLSSWFNWLVENSNQAGRTDLEFIGRFNTKFAGFRYLLEFKYFSNRKMEEKEWNPETFKPLSEDIRQVGEYHKAIQQEYPEARLQSFLVYCFGNRGGRVFPVLPD